MHPDESIKKAPDKIDEFYLQNRDRFDKNVLTLENVRVHMLFPIVESSSNPLYEQSLAQALKTNKQFFGKLPLTLKIVFVDTTDDFNFFPPTKKEKGDILYGKYDVDEGVITALTPQGITAESSVMKYRDDPVETVFKNMVTHEVAHLTTDFLAGPRAVYVPSWFTEGIPSLFIHEPGLAATPSLVKDLAQTFTNLHLTQPDERVLWNTYLPGRENRAPVIYAFGKYFLEWLTHHYPPSSRIESLRAVVGGKPRDKGERYHLIPEFLEYFSWNMRPFSSTFQNFFKIGLSPAYRQFITNFSSEISRPK